MAVQFDIDYDHLIQSTLSLEKTFAYFSAFDTAVGKHFPGLKSFRSIGKSDYEWTFQPFETKGQVIQIHFGTRFVIDPQQRIQIDPILDVGNSTLKGAWDFRPTGERTSVRFQIQLGTTLPIPFFMKPIANALVQSEIGKYFERYASNIERSLTQ